MAPEDLNSHGSLQYFPQDEYYAYSSHRPTLFPLNLRQQQSQIPHDSRPSRYLLLNPAGHAHPRTSPRHGRNGGLVHAGARVPGPLAPRDRRGVAQVHGPAGGPAPASPSHILDVDTLSHRVDPRAGRLHAVRAIAGRPPPLPLLLRGLVASLGGAGDVVLCLCMERTTVDCAARAMRVVYRNATFRRVVDVEERCCYAPHPERPDEWTLFTQETTIRCAPLAAVSATVAEMVERRCAESFAQNAAQGTDVVERICQGLAEGEK